MAGKQYLKIETRKSGPFFEKKTEKNVASRMNEAIILSGYTLLYKLRSATPEAVKGKLRSSWILTRYKTASGMLAISVENVSDYVLTHEYGRKPAYVPYKPLLDWVILKMGNHPEARRIAWFIKKKKEHYPTKGKNVFTPIYDSYADKIDRNVESSIEKGLTDG